MREPEVGTLPIPAMVALLALLDDHRNVTLLPRVMFKGDAVNELILGVRTGLRTTMVIVRGVARPPSPLTLKR